MAWLNFIRLEVMQLALKLHSRRVNQSEGSWLQNGGALKTLTAETSCVDVFSRLLLVSTGILKSAIWLWESCVQLRGIPICGGACYGEIEIGGVTILNSASSLAGE